MLRETMDVMHRLRPTAMTLVALMTACTSQPREKRTLSIVDHWAGQQYGAAVAETAVVRTAGEWQLLWRKLHRSPPRELDPTSEMAVAVYLGTRATAGYSVDITSAAADAAGVLVSYRESAPQRDALTAHVITRPWAVAVLPALNGEVVFHQAQRPTDHSTP